MERNGALKGGKGTELGSTVQVLGSWHLCNGKLELEKDEIERESETESTKMFEPLFIFR